MPAALGDAIELGVSYISIVGETSGLVRDGKLALRQVQAHATANPIKLKTVIDQSHIKTAQIPLHADSRDFGRDVQAAIHQAERRSGSIVTESDLDTKPARASMVLLRRELSSGAPIDIGVHLDTTGLAAAVAGAGAAAGAVELTPNLSGFADGIQSELARVDLSGFTDRLRDQVAPVFADIGGPVDLDTAATSARLDELTRDRRIHIGIDVDWFPVLSALAALVALRRMVTIDVGIPVDQVLDLDTTLAALTRSREVTIAVELDQPSIGAAETRLDTLARNRRVELNVDSAALAGLTALGSHTVTLDVALNQGAVAAVNAVLDHLARDRTVTFHAEVDAASAVRVNELLDRIAARRTVDIGTSLDRADAARMEILLALLTRDRHINVESDGLGRVRSGAEDAHRSLSAMAGIKFTALIAGIGALAPLIGGAAGAALGAVGALGVGLAALGPAAAAAGATAALGIQGIGDAFKALSAASDSAGADAAAQAKAVAAAQDQVAAAHEQVRDALDNVVTAQQNLTDAQKDARDAAQDIARAYKDATEELEDYNFAVKDASLSEAEAKLALTEARTEFAKALPQDREKAYLRLQRADLRYQQSVEKNKDVQAEANDALAKGVEGSDKVVAAKDRAAQADRRVAEAQKGVEKANEQVEKANRAVEKAQAAVAEATNKTSSAQDKAAQAFAKLSPNAQAFVLATRELIPAWTDLRKATQDALFADSAQGIKDLVTASFPTLKAGMVEVAGSMNGLTKQFAAFWSAPQNLAGVQSIFSGTANFINGLGPGLQQATQGFLSLGQAFEPVANKVGAQFAGMLGQIGQAFTSTFQNGQLTQLISTFGDILQGLGAGLNPLIQGLIEMGNLVGPKIGPLFEQFGKSVQILAPSLGRLGATFVDVLTKLLPDLTKFIDALAVGLEPVLPVIGELLRSVLTALTPMIGPLSQVAQIVGTTLAQAISALAPSIGPLSEAFVSLVGAVAPILPMVAEVAAGILSALAPALKTIFDALGPVIKQWADLMLPVFRQLQPILADVASKIGNALADALVQISPYIPDIARAFSDLVLAIAPLLPQIVEMAVQLLPPMLDLFIAILPQLLDLIDVFTWLVTNVIEPLVLPAMNKVIDIFGKVISTVASTITTARDTIGSAVNAIAGFFTGLGSTVSKVWDTIVRTIKSSVATIGIFLVGLPEIEIPDLPGIPGRGTKVGFRGIGQAMVAWGTAPLAGGGIAGRRRDGSLYGPGTATSDSIVGLDLRGIPTALVSTGEGVVKTSAMNRGGAELVAALNAGWVPSPELLHAMLPGFAQGGVPGKKFAQSMDPAAYLMGGFSRTAIDCSGMVAATVNDALGLNPFAGRMSTVNEGAWLAQKGAKPGLGGAGDISIGWYDRGGGANGHTAMTLGDGTNVESRGGDGVVIGANARGARDPMFDKHMYLPAALLQGGDLGGPASAGGRGLGASGGPSRGLGGGTGAATTAPGATPGTTAPGTAAPGATSPGALTNPSVVPSTNNPVPVLITNWPSGGIGLGTPNSGASPSPSLGVTADSSADFATPADALRSHAATPSTPEEEALRATLSATPAPGQTPITPPAGGPQQQGGHPLANLPVPGFDKLFNGPAPWYLAGSPEQALANLGTQAASLAQRTGSDVMGFFQNNWKEMLGTGLAVAGMGAGGGGGGPQMIVNNTGMDPQSAAAAVERVIRRRTLANQRGGGFGR